MSEEFFIGWQKKAPEQTGRFLKRLTIGCLLLATVSSAIVAGLQQTVAKDAVWNAEFIEFSGILIKDPVPILIGDDNEVRLLARPLKFGFDPEVAARFHLKHITLEGRLISRDGQELIEGDPQRVRQSSAPSATIIVPKLLDGEEVTLQGEIVDSKCYLGMMNPGHLKAHRACAINCIAGGVPPVLLLRNTQGEASYLLLVGEQGQAINHEILPLVAEPVEVRGSLKSLGHLSVIYADRDGIQLIK